MKAVLLVAVLVVIATAVSVDAQPPKKNPAAKKFKSGSIQPKPAGSGVPGKCGLQDKYRCNTSKSCTASGGSPRSDPKCKGYAFI